MNEISYWIMGTSVLLRIQVYTIDIEWPTGPEYIYIYILVIVMKGLWYLVVKYMAFLSSSYLRVKHAVNIIVNGTFKTKYLFNGTDSSK